MYTTDTAHLEGAFCDTEQVPSSADDMELFLWEFSLRITNLYHCDHHMFYIMMIHKTLIGMFASHLTHFSHTKYLTVM